jgi:hypothetical protein
MASKTVKPVPARKKSTTATDNPKEPSINTITVNKQAEGNSYKIILTVSTTSLSGSCDLQIQLGLSDSGDLYLRIYSSTGTGLYSRQWISLDEAWQCLTDWPHGPVTAMALFPMFRNRSVNTAGYTLSVLLSLGLLTPSQEKTRHFDLVDDDRFAAIVADLNATHSTPAKRKPKAKV